MTDHQLDIALKIFIIAFIVGVFFFAIKVYQKHTLINSQPTELNEHKEKVTNNN